MHPTELAVSDDANGNCLPPGQKKTGKTSKTEKSKIPAGFALMHGFTATNVGKNRLTVSSGGGWPSIFADFLDGSLNLSLAPEYSVKAEHP